MCAIYGEVNCADLEWLKDQEDKALLRGIDLSYIIYPNYSVYHTRLATNDSKDTYPIALDNCLFAMNGIIGEQRYDQLKEKYQGKVDKYSVDSAYFLREIIDTGDFENFDNDDYVFAFWLINGSSLYIGNKDYPLYIKDEEEGIRFSSFDSEGFKPLGNRILEYSLHSNTYYEVYKYKNLIYNTGE